MFRVYFVNSEPKNRMILSGYVLISGIQNIHDNMHRSEHLRYKIYICLKYFPSIH